jgi:hypothetical protein
MNKRQARSTTRVLSVVLVLALLVLVSGYASAQPRAVATSVVEMTKLAASDGAESDFFGGSVSISGDTLVVGASWDDDKGVNSGSAYVLERNEGGPNNWGQAAKLAASEGGQDDEFGISVSISGDTVVVGAHFDDDNGFNSGSAYVFERDEGGAGNWGEVTKLTAFDGADVDVFGVCVSISGDTLVVGARNNNSNGSAYVFERDAGGAGTWGQVAKLTASDGAAYDYFGTAVSISGDTVVIGADGDEDSGYMSGSAYLFERPVTGWADMTETAKLTASDGAEEDGLGYSISISSDTVIAGARGDAPGGSAYLFEKPVTGWENMTETAKLTASDGAWWDDFGNSVSISGDTVVVAAFLDDDAGDASGSAYQFERDEGGPGNWGQVTKLSASDGSAGDMFGNWVSVSGDTLVVGAWWDDDNGDASGSAYVFAPFEPVAWVYLPVVLRSAP